MATCWQCLLYFWWEGGICAKTLCCFECRSSLSALPPPSRRDRLLCCQPSPRNPTPVLLRATKRTRFTMKFQKSRFLLIVLDSGSVPSFYIGFNTELKTVRTTWQVSFRALSLLHLPLTKKRFYEWSLPLKWYIWTLKLSVTSLSIRINSKAESGYFCQLFT